MDRNSEVAAMVVSTHSREDQMVEDLMLTEQGRFLELHQGRLREKPADMSEGHNFAMSRVTRQIAPQLDPQRYDFRISSGRVRRGERTWYIPDFYLITYEKEPSFDDDLARFEIFDDPLPLIVEIWSPSTGGYDVAEKLPEYMRRGDRELWFIHPREKTLTAWRRQADGTYVESVHRAGCLELAAVPGVVIDLDALFA